MVSGLRDGEGGGKSRARTIVVSSCMLVVMINELRKYRWGERVKQVDGASE